MPPWHPMTPNPASCRTNDPIEKLDVTLVQKYVLEQVYALPFGSFTKVQGVRSNEQRMQAILAEEYPELGIHAPGERSPSFRPESVRS